MSSPLTQAAVLEIEHRLNMVDNFEYWCRQNLPDNQSPALHHLLTIHTIEQLIRGKLLLPNDKIAHRLLIMQPPGSAKSTYTSWLLAPWFLAQSPNKNILACSHSFDLVKSFGRRCRNTIDEKGKWLGYELSKDSKAADSWDTSNGGSYLAVGVNAGIAGRRADLGLIDDPIGDELQAQSKLFRDRLWDWYHNDFVPRLKPDSFRILICNRRHEDDLAGRLIDPKFSGNETSSWYVLSLPMEAGINDPLSRIPGERLWPEWFTEEMITDAKKNPRTWSGLYQQNPTPESGNVFKRDWMIEYSSLNDLPKNLRIYVTSDHAVSTERGANKNCFIPFGLDGDNHIWILPDVFWKVASPLDSVNAMFDIVKRRQPLRWRAEKGHISKSLRPLIDKFMEEKGLYFVIEEVTPSSDKLTRSGPIQGWMQQHRVHFPSFAPWYSDALFELMTFTGSGDDKADDFADALSHIGLMINTIVRPGKTSISKPSSLELPFIPTLSWAKASTRYLEKQRLAHLDN